MRLAAAAARAALRVRPFAPTSDQPAARPIGVPGTSTCQFSAAAAALIRRDTSAAWVGPGAGQHHHELVAGEPGHEVTASHDPIQHPGDALQDQVAAVPAVPGVDRGEADQVADADRGAFAAGQHGGHVAARAGGGWAGR